MRFATMRFATMTIMRIMTRHILYIILAAAALVGCSDDIIPGDVPSGEGGVGTGEMVFFSSGTTETEVSRAPSTYYMPDAHRFVCRMYYKAHTGSDLFDINGTDQTAWLKVSGNVGNSLYWNKAYTIPSQYDPYGNDKSAHAFYWQNRKPHAFLAWTDLNHATTMKGGTTSGTLTSEGKDTYRVKATGTITSWTTLEYDIYDGGQYTNIVEMSKYVRDTYLSGDTEALAEFNERQEEFGKTLDWVDATKHLVSETESYYSKNTQSTPVDGTHRKYGWYKYVITDEDQNPLCTFYFERYQELKTEDRYDEYAANAFDLTRGTKSSMAEQPDIAQALTIQAPTGATQEGNRVNLYFKHQFSQVQVNIKNSADNSVTLQAADVLKVELLGVSEEGYVFTDLDADGNVRPAAYKPIDFSKYSEKDLEANKFGTSFDMFELPEAETETGFLKSFNALTFGQLQAIRITWKEEDYIDAEGKDHDGVRHFPTYRIPPPTATDDLMNLKSGMRYIWNIEIRRGTLAVIRTEIVDWELPTDAPYNGHTEGTITN